MGRNLYIADTHFGHKKILLFDKRPFFTVEEMEEEITENWNMVVESSDTVYILGDFCWGKENDWLRVLEKLNGNKVLIRGNHDLKNMSNELQNKFQDIKDYKEIVDNGKNVIMCHYPILFYKKAISPEYYMLCGHVHITQENKLLEQWTNILRNNHKENESNNPNCGNIINVGCMMPWMEYTPRTLDEIIDRRKLV